MPALDDLSSAIHGRLEIVGNGGVEQFERGVSEKLAHWRNTSVGARMVSFLAGRAPVAGAAVVVALFFIGEGGVGSATLAHAAVLASVTPAFAGVAKQALDIARALVRASPIAARLDRIRHRLPDGAEVPSLPAAFTWKEVSFAYPAESRPILSGVDVRWEPGTFLGLAGQNGSGKSTFVRILLGLHAPTSGGVLVGEIPLDAIDRTLFRHRVGYLAQRPFLPDHMTVAQAIRLLSPDATVGGMQEILAKLSLWPVLVRRSSEAPLDVKLSSLSAGEKQRVALARVLLREAPLLLLDEPDANLDAEGVALVAALLRAEATKRMVLVVAHSQVLLASVDRVLHFEDGKVLPG
jgi:ABC-type multidrug transport system fused ATPase/permease subunit